MKNFSNLNRFFLLILIFMGALPGVAAASMAPQQMLEDHGISYEGVWIHDWTRTQGGGLHPYESAYRFWLDLHVEADLETSLGWTGGTFGADLWHTNGNNGSVDAGVIQEISAYESYRGTRIAEVWLEQVWEDSGVRVKVGKMDPTAEFAFVDFGWNYMNTAVSYPMNLIGVPVYPDPAFGGAAFFEFDGGAWFHTGSFDRFSGSVQRDATGYYLTAERPLWEEWSDSETDQGIAGLFRATFADEEVSAFEVHTVTGLVWTGAIPDRDQDELGLAYLRGELSSAAGATFQGDAEEIIELYYRIPIRENLSIQPSLQRVINPGGRYEDLWVPGIRVELTF
jgi:carbohydrate-selective porin OprB